MPTMRLPVKMTTIEMLDIGDQMATTIAALENVRAERSKVMAGFNARIKNHEGLLHDLKEALISGVIEREVDVFEEPDYTAKVMRTLRLDTGAEVKNRYLTPDEMQGQLFDNGKTAPSAVAAERAAMDDARGDALDAEITERVNEALVELNPKVHVKEDRDPTGSFFVASIETPSWRAEAHGKTENDARDRLAMKIRTRLIADFTPPPPAAKGSPKGRRKSGGAPAFNGR